MQTTDGRLWTQRSLSSCFGVRTSSSHLAFAKCRRPQTVFPHKPINREPTTDTFRILLTKCVVASRRLAARPSCHYLPGTTTTLRLIPQNLHCAISLKIFCTHLKLKHSLEWWEFLINLINSFLQSVLDFFLRCPV